MTGGVANIVNTLATRKPEMMAEAAYRIFTKKSTTFRYEMFLPSSFKSTAYMHILLTKSQLLLPVAITSLMTCS